MVYNQCTGFLDFIISCVGLILLSPLLLMIVVLLYLTGEGEIFFCQDRVGKNGKFFKLYKFVTMIKDSPNIGTGTITLQDDPRVLPLGKFLRKTKLNELPQLMNVLIGDMSIVGPRPQEIRCFNAFPPNLRKKIISCKPGLSGLGSIIFRSEEKIITSERSAEFYYDQVISPYKAELEQWYVEHQSIYVYFMVIILTAWTLFYLLQALYGQFLEIFPILQKFLKNIYTLIDKNISREK